MARQIVMAAAMLLGAAGCVPSAAPVASLDDPRAATATPVRNPTPRPSAELKRDRAIDAVLVAGAAGAHFGRLELVTWRNQAWHDRPAAARALPAIRIAPATPLKVWVPHATPIVSWMAEYAAAVVEPGQRAVRLGQLRGGPSASVIRLATPPPGSWVLSVNVAFEAGVRGATYSWLLIVSPGHQRGRPERAGLAVPQVQELRGNGLVLR